MQYLVKWKLDQYMLLIDFYFFISYKLIKLIKYNIIFLISKLLNFNNEFFRDVIDVVSLVDKRLKFVFYVL